MLDTDDMVEERGLGKKRSTRQEEQVTVEGETTSAQSGIVLFALRPSFRPAFFSSFCIQCVHNYHALSNLALFLQSELRRPLYNEQAAGQTTPLLPGDQPLLSSHNPDGSTSTGGACFFKS